MANSGEDYPKIDIDLLADPTYQAPRVSRGLRKRAMTSSPRENGATTEKTEPKNMRKRAAKQDAPTAKKAKTAMGKALTMEVEDDAGVKDIGVKDAEMKDTGVKDAGLKDTGLKDAEPEDGEVAADGWVYNKELKTWFPPKGVNIKGDKPWFCNRCSLKRPQTHDKFWVQKDGTRMQPNLMDRKCITCLMRDWHRGTWTLPPRST